ncbi:hypothetical protein QQS21_009842 [Conoideocrella luteorostrata]|uniref:Zn(2)-C6 fungal-type domain-containing protein n=1 Tax=Conoideocrella luteorostrata TaxID=1105319 RepID=A0AAJ0CG65_9HYPO|nr:hypothetical protein QQS21_009842 [Conoideocrella luteorostrata]
MPGLDPDAQREHSTTCSDDQNTSRRPARTMAYSLKLKDSCQSCAAAKIRCPKEKPACSNCANRGIKCIYSIARRPGRTRDASRANGTTTKRKTNSSPSSSPPTNNKKHSGYHPNTQTTATWYQEDRKIAPCVVDRSFPTATAAVSSASPVLPPSSLATNSTNNIIVGNSTTPALRTYPSSLTLDNVFSPASEDVFPHLGGDVGFLDSLADFDINEIDFTMNSFDASMIYAPNNTRSILTPDENFNYDLSSIETPHTFGPMGTSSKVLSLYDESSTTTTSVQTPETSVAPSSDCYSSPCTCVPQALDLLKMLSSTPSLFYTGVPTTMGTTDADLALTVLIENKQNIEAVRNRLACSSCAEDTFLLTILFMIVLKILERYAAVAHTHIYGTDPCRAGDSDTASRLASGLIASDKEQLQAPSGIQNAVHDDARGHIVDQLVLSELHDVQQLVNQLSLKFRGIEEGGDSRQTTEGGGKVALAQFSAATLVQMESDVRKRLSALGLISSTGCGNE